MSFGIFDTLSQYGILGLVVLALGYVVWILFNRTLKSEDDLKQKVEELEGEHRGIGEVIYKPVIYFIHERIWYKYLRVKRK